MNTFRKEIEDSFPAPGVKVHPRRKVNPTDRTRTVRLTLGEWNSLQTYLTDSRNYNREHGYNATSVEVSKMKEKIEAQIGAAVDTAFNKEFPDLAD